MKKTVMVMNFTAVILSSVMFNCYSCSNIYAQNIYNKEDQMFTTSFQDLINKAILVTHNYDIQIQKWKKGEYSNNTMVSVTDSYLPNFQELIALTKNLHTPTKFKNVTELYLKSLESELQSNILFRNNLVSSNSTESMLSTKLYSDALRYEMESFRAFESAAAETDKNDKFS
jgi:hypothetical protein